MSVKYVICDIDGTIADNTHRLHYIEGYPKEWSKFHDSVGGDAPYTDMIALVNLLVIVSNVEVVYVSGRMERCREDTMRWLAENHLTKGKLYMRKDDDFRPDYVIKKEIAEEAGFTPENVWLALDDRDQIVEMWRSNGYRCLQVRDGDF